MKRLTYLTCWSSVKTMSAVEESCRTSRLTVLRSRSTCIDDIEPEDRDLLTGPTEAKPARCELLRGEEVAQ